MFSTLRTAEALALIAYPFTIVRDTFIVRSRITVLGLRRSRLACFEVTNAPHKNMKDVCIVSDVNNCGYERTITKFQSCGTVFMMFRLALKFGLHRVLKTDQRRKSRTPCSTFVLDYK